VTGPDVARRIVNLEDLRARAKRRLPRVVFDYLDGGAGRETTLHHNRAAWDRYRLVPRALIDARRTDASTHLFGHHWARPYGIAPTGMANMIWPGSDLALARHAMQRGMPMVAATPASTSLEDLAQAAPQHVWFQLYPTRDDAITDDLLHRAENAGIDVLVVTVDVPTSARRERDLRNGLSLPFRLTRSHSVNFALHPRWTLAQLRAGAPRFANLERYFAPTAAEELARFMTRTISSNFAWTDLERIRNLWKHTLVVKGLLSVADVEHCALLGCDGAVLSNHGGRQLDSAASPLDVLASVRERAGNRLSLIVDGGVRTGGDIVKAIALGADFVLLGRAGLYGAAAFGPMGVQIAYDIIEAEFANTLAQFGCPTFDDLRRCRHEGHMIHASAD